MNSQPLRIAMWSGPRNISTAMMRSWGNRPDTAVIDEPLYAHYLHATRREHRGAAEVISAGPINEKVAIEHLLGPVPGDNAIFYQKHMTHHLLPNIPREWMRRLTNCFLIRDPRQMLTSLLKHVPDAKLADTGYAQQAEIFDLVCGWDNGDTPPVLDSRDVLNNPRGMLAALCNKLGVSFDERMLSWEPGLRVTDGVWAKYWYAEVETTTSFQPYHEKSDRVPVEFRELLDQSVAYYDRLYGHRLTA